VAEKQVKFRTALKLAPFFKLVDKQLVAFVCSLSFPYLTPDNRYLFFTTGNNSEADWKVKWVNITAELVAN